MDIQYNIIQEKGCYIVMPVFAACPEDSIPQRRLTAMNEFYAGMTDTIRTYAAALQSEFPGSRYICQGEAEDTGSVLHVCFRLYRRSPGQTGTSRVIRQVWQNGLLVRHTTER